MSVVGGRSGTGATVNARVLVGGCWGVAVKHFGGGCSGGIYFWRIIDSVVHTFTNPIS